MKTLKKHFRCITCVMAILILFQSCKAYHKDPVTLDQAVEAKKSVKVETNANQTFKFKYIIMENDAYYGIERIKGEFIKTLINASDVEKVNLENKPISILSSAFITLGLCAILLVFVGAAAVGGAF